MRLVLVAATRLFLCYLVGFALVGVFAHVWVGGPVWGRNVLEEFYTFRSCGWVVELNGWSIGSIAGLGDVMLLGAFGLIRVNARED